MTSPAGPEHFDQLFHIVSHKRGSRSEINGATRTSDAVTAPFGPVKYRP
jgi:hypothetical protein